VADNPVGDIAEGGEGRPTSSDADHTNGANETAPPGVLPSAGSSATDPLRAEPVDVHPPTRFEHWVYRAIWLLAFTLAKVWFRLEFIGRDNIPKRQPFVLAPVHRSNLDFLLVALLTRRRLRYMTKASVWKSKALGQLAALLGGFPVHRGTADRVALRTALQVIDNGEPVVLFPEGTRRSGPVVEEVFDGPAYVASRAEVPILPVGIGGSEEAMPKGARWIRPRKVTVVVGDALAPGPKSSNGRVPRRVIRELTDQLRDEVQALYDEARTLAGSSP
jgi:1-acyl-sn-glycerol-3-phosphate acyltransferase